MIRYRGTVWDYLGVVPILIREEAGGGEWTIYFDPHHCQPCPRCRNPVHRATLRGSLSSPAPRVFDGANRRDEPRCALIVSGVIGFTHEPCGCGGNPYIKRTP